MTVAARERSAVAPSDGAPEGRHRLESAARWVLVAIGAVAAGGALYLASLAVALEAGALLGFLLGVEAERVASVEMAYVAAATALASLFLGGVWVTYRCPRRAIWSLPRIAEALSTPRASAIIIGLGLIGYLAYGRLVFLYYRIAGGVDEGMYLVAAREALGGKLPYRDFPSIQGPLYPYLLGLILGPFSFDERAARLFAIGVVALTLLVVAAAATRFAGRLGGVLAFLLLLTNLDFVTEQSSGVQPSGPTGSLLVALAALAFAGNRPVLAIVPLGIAAGTRVLFAPLAVLAVLVAALWRRDARRPLAVGIVLALLTFGPFLVAAPRAFWFDTVGYQSQRAAIATRLDGGLPDTLRTRLAGIRSGALAELGAYWPLLAGLGVSTLLLSWARARERLGQRRTLTLGFLVTGTGAMFLVDLLPDPFNPRYPVPQLPLAAVAGGSALAWLIHEADSPGTRSLAAVVAASLLLANPFVASREAAGSPNFVETYRPRPPVEALDEVAAFVRAVTPEDGVLITLETPIASQARRPLWPGLELASWGVLSLPDDDARAVGMTTPGLLAEAIESRQASAVIASDRYTWELPRLPNRERIQRALKDGYRLAQEFPDVSDWGTVRVFLPAGG